jgi:hypothetical protein
MSLRWFYPSAPWTSEHHQKVRLYGNVMPLIHAAAIMRCDKTKLINLCKGNRISYAPKIHGVEYSAYLHVDDFPKLLRSLEWSQSDIDKGMAQIYEVINRPSSTRGGNRRAATVSQQKQAIVEDEEEEEEEDSLPSRKRSIAKKEEHDNEDAPAWAKELKTHMDKTFENCFAMVGPQVVPFYFGTKKWKTEKPAAIQAHLNQIMPALVAEVRADLEKTLAPRVERELRQRMEREFEENMEKEDAFKLIEHLRRTESIAVTKTLQQEAGDMDEEEVQAFLKEYYAKNHTE